MADGAETPTTVRWDYQRMSIEHSQFDRSTDAASFTTDAPTDDTRHSREDAVETKTFEFLVEATYEMDEYYGIQCRFVLFMAGRLGMRAGEIAHMDDSWLDPRRKMICIPRHDPCEKGRDGGICGQCRSNVVQKCDVRTGEVYDDRHARLTSRDEFEPGGGVASGSVIPESELAETAWAAKTDAAAREIPFDSVVRAGLAVDRFFEHFDAFPHSQSAVNRRVDRMARQAQGIEEGDVYPHALRASAATFWADHGLNAHSLKGLMGWSQLSTARNYISDSSERTASAMRDATI